MIARLHEIEEGPFSVLSLGTLWVGVILFYRRYFMSKKCLGLHLRKGWKCHVASMLAIVMSLLLFTGWVAPAPAHAQTIGSTTLNQTIDKWMIDESSGYIYATTSDTMQLLFISLSDLQVKKQISYLSSPTDITADSGKLYVPLAGTSQISIVDIASQSVTGAVYTSNGNPYRVAVDGNNLYYVLQNNFSFVTVKNLTTNAETQIGAPLTANSIYMPALGLDKANHVLYSAQSGLTGGNITAYDTQTNTINASNKSNYNEGYGFTFPDRILLVDGQDVFHAGRRLNKSNLAEIKGDYYPDLQLGRTDIYYVKGSHVFTNTGVFDRDSYVKTADLPYATKLSLMDNAGNTYLFNPTAKTIDKVSLSFVPVNTVTGDLKDNKLTMNAAVTKMVYSSQTGYMYAIAPTFNKLLTIDPFNMSIVRQVDVGSKPSDLVISGGKLYISLYGATQVAVTDDVYGGGIVSTLVTAQNPHRLAVSDGSIFYLPEFPETSGDRSVYVMPVNGGASQKVQYTSPTAYNYYYKANLLADEANHVVYIGETSSSPRYLYSMSTIPSAGKYPDPKQSAGIGATGEALVQEGSDLFYGDSRFDANSLAQLNGSSLYSPEVIAVKGNYIITKTSVYDKTTIGKLFDMPYTADAGLILNDGSVLLYSSAKGALFRYSNVEEIKIPRELVSNVKFTDNDPTAGSIQGTVSWTNPADTSYLTGYSLYYLDAQGNPISLISRVPNTTTSYTVNTITIPTGASRIGVFSYNQYAESIKCTSTLIWDLSSYLPQKIDFLDTNPAKGQIHGILSWTPAADESSFSKYAVYFTGSTGNKLSSQPYRVVNNKQISYSLDIPESDIPTGASSIVIYSMADNGEISPWNAFVRIADNIQAEPASVTTVTYNFTNTATYLDTDPTAGKINGQLSWQGVSLDLLGGSYKVYFLDASYKTIGSIAEVPIDVIQSYRVTLPSDTLLPSGAVYFGIVRRSSTGIEETKAYIVSINDLGGTSPTSPTPTQSGSNPGTTPSSETPKPVITSSTDGRTIITLTLTNQQLKTILENQLSNSENSTINLQVVGQGSIMQSVLSGTAFQEIVSSNEKALLSVNTSLAAITIQAAEIQKSLQQFGQEGANVSVSITIARTDDQIRSNLDALLRGARIKQITGPIDFRITATVTTDNRQFEISSTTSFVAHTIPLPAAVTSDSIKTLAGVMYDPATNMFYPVPTVFTTGTDGIIQASLYRQGNSIYTVVSNPKSFGDLPDQHYAKDAIETLASKFVISGYEDNTFKADKPVTRAEFATLLMRAMGIVPKPTANIPFKDVLKGEWYYEAVAAAADAGFISGYEDGTFRPNQTVSRQEMTKMIFTALRSGGFNKQLTLEQQEAAISRFSDKSTISSWAKEAAAYAGETGIMNGTADGSFEGSTNADRAQTAVILYRMMKTIHFIN